MARSVPEQSLSPPRQLRLASEAAGYDIDSWLETSGHPSMTWDYDEAPLLDGNDDDAPLLDFPSPAALPRPPSDDPDDPFGFLAAERHLASRPAPSFPPARPALSRVGQISKIAKVEDRPSTSSPLSSLQSPPPQSSGRRKLATAGKPDERALTTEELVGLLPQAKKRKGASLS